MVRAENADPGEFLDQRQRYQQVAAVPVLSRGRHCPLGEAAHLVADQIEGRIVEPDPPEPALADIGQQYAKP